MPFLWLSHAAAVDKRYQPGFATITIVCADGCRAGIAYASIAIEDSQFNIITQNFMTDNCMHGMDIGANVIDNTISLNHFQNNPGHGIVESSSTGSTRNSYTDNKFANIGFSALSIRQNFSTFSGNTIRQANLRVSTGSDGATAPRAAIEIAAGSNFISVMNNKVSSTATGSSTTGVYVAPGGGDHLKVLGNSIGHLPVPIEMTGVTGEHNDVAYNN